jgi:hypothetical protein
VPFVAAALLAMVQISFLLLCHTLGFLAKSGECAERAALVAIFRVCNTCENSSEGAYPEDLEQ